MRHKRSHSMHSTQGHDSGREETSGMPPQEASELFIATFFPVLAQEVQACNALFIVPEGAQDGGEEAAAHALLAGIPEAAALLIDTVKPSKALPCLGMVGTVLYWQAKLSTQPGGGPVCTILQDCERKLRALWEAYTNERVLAIQKFDGKSALGGPSSVHVLPFVVNLEAVASRVDNIVMEWAQREGAAAATAPVQTQTAPSDQSNAGTTRRLSPFESDAGSGDLGLKLPAVPAGVAPASFAKAVTSMAEAFFRRVLDAMVEAIEAHAGGDPKHGPRVRLENYAFMRLTLQGFSASSSPVLHKYCSEAASRRNTAVAAYVENLVEEAKLTPALHLASQLMQQVGAGVPAAEAPSRLDMSPGEARQVASAAGTGLEKRLVGVRQRISKQMASSSPYLVDVVWERLEVRCTRAWEDLEKLVPVCFGGLSIQPKAAELQNMFATAKMVTP